MFQNKSKKKINPFKNQQSIKNKDLINIDTLYKIRIYLALYKNKQYFYFY